MPNLTEQMNNLPSNTEVVSSNEDMLKIIRTLNEKEGSNVQVLKDNKRIFGAVDMNDPNRHYIINMDDFDSALGIIEPHEQAVAADPRQAGQLAYKRNWKNRLEKLSTLQKTDPVQREPATTGREDYRSEYDAGVRRAEQEVGREPFESGARSAYKKYDATFVGGPTGVKTDKFVYNQADEAPDLFLQAQEQDARERFRRAGAPVGHGNRTSPATPDALQTAEGFMRERLKTDSGWTPPSRSDAGPTPINRGEPYVRLEDPEQKSEPQKLINAVLPAYDPEDNPDKSNNPGNVKAVKEDFHQQAGITEDGFAQFTDPRWGLRTLFMTLLRPRYKNKTISEIAKTYSPHKNERGEIENTVEEIEGKIQVIAQELAKFGIADANSKVDLNDPQILAALARAIIKSEKVPEEAEYYLNLPQDVWEYAQKTAPIDMQAGGEVPQINKSGLIQGEGGPTTDSIPMRAEPDSFIVNAPAVEMVGKQNLDSAIHKVQKQQQQSGFNQFGNPVTGAQDINVSKKDAERIGYDNLNRINDAGKPFVEQIDKRGYAEGDRVPLPVKKPSFVPTPIPKPEMLNVSGVDSLFSRADKQNLVNLLYAEDPTGRDTKKILDVIFNRIVHANKSQQRAKDFGKDNVTNILGKRGQFSPVHRAFNKKDTGETTLEFKRDAAKRLRKATPEALSSIERIVDEQLDHIRAGTYKSDVGDSTHYRNVDKSAPDEWWDTALTPYTVGEGGHTFYTIKDSDSSVPRPTSKPKMEERAFVSDPVNLLDIPEDSSKPKIEERTFISPGGSDVYPPTDITLPPDAQDVEEYNKFKETFYN